MSFTLVCILVASILKKIIIIWGQPSLPFIPKTAQHIYPKSTVIMSVIILDISIWELLFSEALEKWSAHLPSSCSISLLIEALFELIQGPAEN